MFLGDSIKCSGPDQFACTDGNVLLLENHPLKALINFKYIC